MAKPLASATLPLVIAAIIACAFLLGYCAAQHTGSPHSLDNAAASSTEGAQQASASSSASAQRASASASAQEGSASSASAPQRASASSDSSSQQASASSAVTSQQASASSSTSKQQASASSSAASSASSSAASSSAPEEEPALDVLYALLGEQTTNKLVANAATSKDAAWVAAHPEAYGVFREHIQVKALTLAADEPLAAAYVRGLPDYPATSPDVDYSATAMDPDSPAESVPNTRIPHLYQWDLRWGYTMYDGDAFGLSGCGPTALAMVYQGLTKKDDKTPYDMGQIAFAGGYVTSDYNGTMEAYFMDTAGQMGLQCEPLPISASTIRTTLEEGRPIIAHVGPGTFSQVGHYFVLTTTANNGEVVINDPYSVERSGQLWDADLIASEAQALYAYSLAN